MTDWAIQTVNPPLLLMCQANTEAQARQLVADALPDSVVLTIIPAVVPARHAHVHIPQPD